MASRAPPSRDQRPSKPPNPPLVFRPTTVLASISGGFDFGHALFTPPARPLLTRAAAQERLAAAPG
eukprot:1240467-Prymnesium_polylepis.1